MTLNDAIGEVTNYTFDFDYVDVIDNIIKRIEDVNNPDEIMDEIDFALTYYHNQWTIAKHFNNSPFELDPNTIDLFVNEVFQVAAKLR